MKILDLNQIYILLYTVKLYHKCVQFMLVQPHELKPPNSKNNNNNKIKYDTAKI
jgi:hypothetical protein